MTAMTRGDDDSQLGNQIRDTAEEKRTERRNCRNNSQKKLNTARQFDLSRQVYT